MDQTRCMQQYLNDDVIGIVSEFTAADSNEVFYCLLRSMFLPYLGDRMKSCTDIYRIASIITSFVMDFDIIQSLHACGDWHPIPMPLSFHEAFDYNTESANRTRMHTRKHFTTMVFQLHREYRYLIPSNSSWVAKMNYEKTLVPSDR
jgi:hypothetical protein